MQQKQRKVDEARELAKAGYPIEQISAMMHHTCKTIRNYLDPGYCVTNGHYNGRITGKLAVFEKEVIELRSQGLTYLKIHSILIDFGLLVGSVAHQTSINSEMFSWLKTDRKKLNVVATYDLVYNASLFAVSCVFCAITPTSLWGI